MALFLIRVEMHERAFNYRLLHDEMERLGCSRQIIADDGRRYDLPEAEYIYANSAVDASTSIRDHFNASLAARGWSFWLLVTRWDQAAWTLKPHTRAGALLASLQNY